MLSVLITLSALLPQEPPKAARSIVEIIPLQPFTTPATPITPPAWGTLLRARPDGGDQVDMLWCSNEERWFDADQALSLLHQLHRDDLDNERLRLDLREDCLHAYGPEQVVQRVTRHVRELSDLVARPIEIEISLWNATDLTDVAGVLAPADHSRLVAGRQLLWRSPRTTHSNGLTCHDRQRWTRYVRDVDTEVAQNAKIALPITDAFCEGGRVIVAPHALVSGDDLVLHVQFAFGAQRGAMRTVPCGLPNAPELDLPTLATMFGTFSGRIQNGGALALLATGHEAGGERLLLTVRATCPTPPQVGQLTDLAIFPISSLTSGALQLQCSLPSPYPLLDDEQASLAQVSDAQSTYAGLDTDALRELLFAALGGLADADGFSLHAAGGFLFVRGERAALTTVGETLRGLEQRLLRTASVRHEGTLQDAAGAQGVLHELSAPTLFGRQLFLARLLETSFVRDLRAEIAQESSTLNPQVDIAQSGTWLRMQMIESPAGTMADMMAQTAHVHALPARNVNPGGLLMPNDVASTRWQHAGKVGNGAPLDHGDGPLVTLVDKSARSTLRTTVKW